MPHLPCSKKRKECFIILKLSRYFASAYGKSIMNKKEQPIYDVSAELAAEFGAPGTPERDKFDEEAYAFYTGQLLLEARKEAKVIQAEMVRRTNTTKSYISRVENGDIVPSVAKFWQMITSLGMRIEILKPIG